MKICVNVGHTLNGVGSGAIGIKSESIENRKVAQVLVKLLKDKGHSVVLSQVDSAKSNNEYLKKCVDIANNSDVEVFVSIHFNVFNKSAKGVECYHFLGNNKGKVLAENICSSISKLGFINRGAKDGSSLYVIKNTKMCAVLVECCFIDNTEDMKIYDVDSMAKAICDGLVGSDKVYRVCVGSFENKIYAEAFLDKVRSEGYKDAFIIPK